MMFDLAIVSLGGIFSSLINVVLVFCNTNLHGSLSLCYVIDLGVLFRTKLCLFNRNMVLVQEIHVM